MDRIPKFVVLEVDMSLSSMDSSGTQGAIDNISLNTSKTAINTFQRVTPKSGG